MNKIAINKGINTWGTIVYPDGKQELRGRSYFLTAIERMNMERNNPKLLPKHKNFRDLKTLKLRNPQFAIYSHSVDIFNDYHGTYEYVGSIFTTDFHLLKQIWSKMDFRKCSVCGKDFYDQTSRDMCSYCVKKIKVDTENN